MNEHDFYAESLSVNSFLNAYCREFSNWEIHLGCSNAGSHKVLNIYLPHETIELKVVHHSDCGRHRFLIPIISLSSQSQATTLNFEQLAQRLVSYAGDGSSSKAGAEKKAARERFLQRVIESRQNIGQFMAARKASLSRLFQPALSFIESEQSLLVGHSVHPAPKVRQPMATQDAIKYGPEGQSGFPLQWLLVRADQLRYQSADAISLQQRVNSILESDAELGAFDWPNLRHYQLLPVHPWQWQQLRQQEQLRKALQQQRIIELGTAGSHWHATSSMRSLYQQHCPYMLKFSLSVRLTNSVRHLQAAEVERGNLICSVLDSSTGARFSKEFPCFSIMREPAYTCLLNEDGAPIAASIMVFRDNPFAQPKHSELVLLAALTQDHPAGQRSCLGNNILMLADEEGVAQEEAARLWFQTFMEVVLKPLILAQANYGMLLGAHQQNIVLAMEQNLPVHCFFRDCQGTGFSTLGVELYQLSDWPQASSAGNHLQQEMGNRLFAYYLIINTTFSVISTIAADGLDAEAPLLDMLKEFLENLLRLSPRDPSFLEYVLNSEQLYHKGNFICSLEDLNENTLADPLSIYKPIANPLAAGQSPDNIELGLKRARSN